MDLLTGRELHSIPAEAGVSGGGHSGQAEGHRLERKEAVKMLNGTVEGQLNVPLLYETLARILNERQTGIKVSVTVRRKDETAYHEAPELEEGRPVAV